MMPPDNVPVLPQALILDLIAAQGIQFFCCGNPDRADDAAGTRLALQLTQAYPHIEVLDGFQWQIEDSLLFKADHLVIFIDAACNQSVPCTLTRVEHPHLSPSPTTSHALSPQQLLSVCQQTGLPSPCASWVMSIYGENFELGGVRSAVSLQGEMIALETAHAAIVQGAFGEARSAFTGSLARVSSSA